MMLAIEPKMVIVVRTCSSFLSKHTCFYCFLLDFSHTLIVIILFGDAMPHRKKVRT